MSEARKLFESAEVCREQLDLVEATQRYYAAERAGYDADRCGAARWTCFMLAGEWERAWLESDEIASRGGPDPNRFWDGREWAGQDVLIRCLHGLGDTLQFVRYAGLIRNNARSLTIEAQPKLKALLQTSSLADRVITWGEPEPVWQTQMEINELPRVFRTTVDTIPNGVPYLLVERQVTAAERLKKGLRVGLVWSASDFDTSRNVPLDYLRPLFELSGITFCSLQAGEGWVRRMPHELVSLSEVDTRIEQIAAEMSQLDLILTVDTMNAHLAGALGRPTWTMLPFQCDWRWMTDREDTPWYPTMRLFRQPSPGDWASVIDQVRAALRLWSSQKTAQAM